MIILIHSSKTMKLATTKSSSLRSPQLLSKARSLDSYLKTLSLKQLEKSMHISSPLAAKTAALIAGWTDEPIKQGVAIDSFVGDIYSGLRAGSLSEDDRQYADKTLRILSGLYGVIRPLDGIYPYRLEMGYLLPKAKYANLYKYWGRSIAKTLPADGLVVNASAEEYTKAVLPYIDSKRVVTPKFLTKDPITNEPKFVTVHSKISRGAYARWLIKNRVNKLQDLNGFDDLNYQYSKALSTDSSPVYVCDSFGGLGLSIRLN